MDDQVYLRDYDDNTWMTIELVTDPKIRIVINHYRPTHSIEKSLSTELQRENDVRIRLLKEDMIIERFLMHFLNKSSVNAHSN